MTEIYFEDLQVGQVFNSGTVTISAEDIIAFASQFDPQPFHTDPVAAVDTFFGGLAASGWHTASLTMRLLATGGLPFTGGLIGANGEISWPAVTRPGDTLSVQSTIEELRPARNRPEFGWVHVESRTSTGAGTVVQVFRARLLVRRRTPTDGPPGQRPTA